MTLNKIIEMEQSTARRYLDKTDKVEKFEDRLNYDVLFFRAGKYHEFGKKLFKQQDHYFNTL